MDDADSDADRSNIDDKQNRLDRIEHNLHRWKMAGYVFLYFFADHRKKRSEYRYK